MQQWVGPAGFTRGLLGAGRRLPVSLPLTRTPTDGEPPRMRWIADAVRKDALYWLFRQGGWRTQQVVTGGRRREGRAWTQGIFEALDVRFSPASLHLLTAIMEESPDLPPLVTRAAQLEPIRAAVAAEKPASGDLLALHRLVELSAGSALNQERPFPLSYDDDGQPHPGIAALQRDLRELEDRVHRCVGLAFMTRDGLVLGVSPQAAERPNLARKLRGFLQAAGKQLDGGWVDLGTGRKSGERVLVRPWPSGAPVVLTCWLQPRTRKVNLTQQKIRERVEGLTQHLDLLGREGLEVVSRGRALARLSPLTLAFRPALNGGLDGLLSTRGAAAERLAPLFVGDRATLLRYLDEPLAAAWLRAEARRRTLSGPEAHAATLALVRGLRAYVQAASGRPDALRPVMLFLARYLLRYGSRIPVVQSLRDQAQVFDRASQRDALLRNASELFGLGGQVLTAAQEALGEAFVERTEEQKVLLTDYHTLFKDVEDEVEAIRRELAGEIG